MTSPTAPLRIAFYHRVARDPALEDSRAHQAQAESVRQYLERFAPLDIAAEDHRAACALRLAAKRFAFYARIAADLPAPQSHSIGSGRGFSGRSSTLMGLGSGGGVVRFRPLSPFDRRTDDHRCDGAIKRRNTYAAEIRRSQPGCR